MAYDGRAHHALEYLPAETGSLARPVPSGSPGNVLYVLGERGGVRVDPSADEFDATVHDVRFGRDESSVQVHVGGGDEEVSRVQGWIYFDGRNWHLTNLGRLDIRLPASRRLAPGEESALPHSYHPLFLDTPRTDRTYVVEVRVTRRREPPPPPRRDPAWDRTQATLEQPEGTRDPSLLTDEDRLVVVALGSQYLRHEDDPRPLSRDRVARTLEIALPGTTWTRRMVDGRITRIRERLTRDGIRGLRADDFPASDPLGNTLNHNLVNTLLSRGAITPRDLRLLDRETG